MQIERTVAVKNIIYMCQFSEVIVNTFHSYHCLTVAIDCQRLVLKGLCCHINFWKLSYLGKQRVVGRSRLTLCGHHHQLWIKACKERSYKIAKAVEHTQRYH